MQNVIKKVFIIILLVICIDFSKKVYSVQIQADINYTKEYKTWIDSDKDSRKRLPIPQTMAVSVKNKKSISNAWLDYPYRLGDISLANKSEFSLKEYIDFEQNNQGKTMECWAFSILTSMESNLKYKQNITVDLSERHMDYATSNSFIDVRDEELKYKRSVSDGAIPQVGLAYLTNGQGAVLEKQMPFENNANQIKYDSIDIEPSYYVTDYEILPTIIKKYDKNGNVNYFDAYGNEYSDSELILTRREIKEYIAYNGAISGVTASNYKIGYDNSNNIIKSKSYCCKDESQIKDHAVTIIGWDDNYSKDNFNGKSKPNSDGAYLVLQANGKNAFDNGYIWISYEDSLIESSLFGISDSKKCDYKNIYQNDFYGSNMSLCMKNVDVGYISSSYDRNDMENEELYQVSISLPQDSEIEIFVNPKDDELVEEKLVKVGSSQGIVEAGYHTFFINPVKLIGNRFAIVIKQHTESKNFDFYVECKMDDSLFYSNVEGKNNSKISLDGKKWTNLNELFLENKEVSNFDFCIKAFTRDNYFSQNQYKNINSKYIKNFLK